MGSPPSYHGGNDMPFQIIRNDITKVEADAIVNTANPLPEVGGGTDWAIHEAAGPELLEAREKIGEISVGESVSTPAFGLPAKYVIHTVSPAWEGGRNGEEELLRKAYDSALSLADELGCRSVAFPLMAAGTYGFPHDVALSVAIRAFTDFLLDHEMQIYLVLFNAAAFGLAGSIFADLESYIDENYVSGKTEEEYRVDGYLPENEKRKPRFRGKASRKNYPDLDFTGASFSLADKPSYMAHEEHAPLSASLEDVLRERESSFSSYLGDLLAESGCKASVVYKRAEISKQLFSRIINNEDYQPSKSTVIQLALGLQLDLPQTQKLLEKAGYMLTRSSKADLAVRYFIERKIFNITLINESLYDRGLPLLKTGLRD